jgi:hypothetical protein
MVRVIADSWSAPVGGGTVELVATFGDRSWKVA